MYFLDFSILQFPNIAPIKLNLSIPRWEHKTGHNRPGTRTSRPIYQMGMNLII